MAAMTGQEYLVLSCNTEDGFLEPSPKFRLGAATLANSRSALSE
jgi:hypothetical protein